MLKYSVSPVLATANLLDSHEFFVCDSRVSGMNGHYVLQPEVTQSDPDTPVFFREDAVDADSGLVLLGDAAEDETDFRLFRHNGFWMIADVEAWPPVTHFRCDPTKTHVVGFDLEDVCALGQPTPPRVGYSPVNPQQGAMHLALHRQACEDQLMQNGDSMSNNFSTRKEEL
ncbi:hypothetical protein BBJ28_00025980 [Nothophytophthora sp. Chile5]|nr:hypothetical protein BBJ28_00025980 [Nothophytophthora sp. Chile5]